MKKFVLANRKVFGISIAIYEILGGIIGLGFVYSLINEETSVGTILIIIMPIVALYLVSLMAGVFYFWKGNEWRFYFLSKLNLCFQVIQLVLAGVSFMFYYGPYLAIGFDGEYNFHMKLEPLTLNFFVRFGDTESQFIMINVIPIVLLIILRWMERNATAKVPDDFPEDRPEIVEES